MEITDSVIGGFIGILLGVIATGLKEWLAHKIKTKKRRNYLATRVVSMLEVFVDKCADIVQDNGKFMGQTGLDGSHCPQAKTPKFLPLSLEVDWLSIDSKLMHQILNFPNEIHFSNSKIENAGKYSDPPEYFDFYKERQYQYSVLAIKAINIITKINKEANLMKPNHKLTWFETELFENTIQKRDYFTPNSNIQQDGISKE